MQGKELGKPIFDEIDLEQIITTPDKVFEKINLGQTVTYISLDGCFHIKKVLDTKRIFEEKKLQEKQLTYFESLQALNKEFKKLFTEIAKHKRSFFDFAFGIMIGTALGYFICFLGR